MKTFPDFTFEKKYWQQNKVVVGVDEVGRGPLAGPVVAGAVIFAPDHQMIAGINDSKKLSEKKRLELEQIIKEQAQAYGIGLASVEMINQSGILAATTFAMTQALKQLTKFDLLLIDGRPINNFPIQVDQIEYIVKGDSRSYSIAAASILAKVYRDQIMKNLSIEFPDYNWEKNMGYGTKKHCDAIKIHGTTKHHRELYIRKIIGQ